MKKDDIVKRVNKNIASAKASGASGKAVINPEPYPSYTPAYAPKTKKKPGRKA